MNGSKITVPADHDGIVGKATLYLNQHELPVPILLDGIQFQPQSKVTLGFTTGSSTTTSTNDETMDDPFHNHTIAYDYFICLQEVSRGGWENDFFVITLHF